MVTHGVQGLHLSHHLTQLNQHRELTLAKDLIAVTAYQMVLLMGKVQAWEGV